MPSSHRSISEVTRRVIADYVSISNIGWAGRMQESEFLARLYDLEQLPSTDHRFSNAAGDIRQHRDGYVDWEYDWVFYDPRFNIIRAPDEEFLGFLAETIHPLVRPDPDIARELCGVYNEHLRADGWMLREVGSISGRPLFQGAKTDARVEIFDEPTEWEKVERQLRGAKGRLDSATSEEHYQTVGLMCRETLISLAEATYDPERYPTLDGISPSRTDAKRMLEALIAAELGGSVNAEARSHAKASLKLAVALQHRRTADFRMAALCCEATMSVVNVIAIVLGQRG